MLLNEWLVFGIPLEASSGLFSMLIDEAAFVNVDDEVTGAIKFPARKEVFGGDVSHFVVL